MLHAIRLEFNHETIILIHGNRCHNRLAKNSNHAVDMCMIKTFLYSMRITRLLTCYY